MILLATAAAAVIVGYALLARRVTLALIAHLVAHPF